ncbi:MAG: tetratricopeptide repeat protein, partial [Pseudomonadota bacterium]
MGELAYFEYKKASAQGRPKEAEASIQKALKYDPKNSTYCLYASQLYLKKKEFAIARDFIERALIEFNGDLTKWSVFYAQGLLNFQTGSLFEANEAFEKSLYYNPTFEAGRKKLEEVNKVIEDHDQIVIKIR